MTVQRGLHRLLGLHPPRGSVRHDGLARAIGFVRESSPRAASAAAYIVPYGHTFFFPHGVLDGTTNAAKATTKVTTEMVSPT